MAANMAAIGGGSFEDDAMGFEQAVCMHTQSHGDSEYHRVVV